MSKALQSLLQYTVRVRRDWLSATLGILTALTPAIVAILLGGTIAALANEDAAAAGGAAQGFAWSIPNPADMLGRSVAPLAKAGYLLLLVLIVIVANSVVLFLFYRFVHRRAVDFEVEMIDLLREHSKQLARVRTLSAQQQALTDGLTYHLPRVRACLSRWWRTYPRHLVQVVLSALAAILIEPTLAALSLIGTCLTTVVYRLIDRQYRTALPVVRERASQLREGLVEQSLRGPLLESVHEEHDLERRFREQLDQYRQDALRSLSSSAWKTPTLTLVGGGMTCLFLIVVAVQVLSEKSAIGLGGAFAFLLCCVAAAVSLVRLQRARREMKTIEGAADELSSFLALVVDRPDNDSLKTIDRVQQAAEMEHVTVQDSRGNKLLDNVCVRFEPQKLIGVVASHPLQANALVELLLGYGRPVSGRLLIDGEVAHDLRPEALSKCSHWVASDGAIVTGTVRENLVGMDTKVSNADLDAAASKTALFDSLQRLTDGFATIITPDDDRLTADATFRVALARAALRDASVLVIDEPSSVSFDPEAEAKTLAGMKSLVCDSKITVVLPKRLATLRSCDQIIMVHEHKVADQGTHAELLQRNELYRHLNYLKFNAFRNEIAN
ncbi:MAG: ATP-binding cassette domain-containing protein [Pirellulaceae bacterium]